MEEINLTEALKKNFWMMKKNFSMKFLHPSWSSS